MGSRSVARSFARSLPLTKVTLLVSAIVEMERFQAKAGHGHPGLVKHLGRGLG